MNKLVRVTITWWLPPGDSEPRAHTTGDMTMYGWVKVGEETVLVPKPEVDPNGCRIKSLEQMREAAAKESAEKLAELDHQIEEARRVK